MSKPRHARQGVYVKLCGAWLLLAGIAFGQGPEFVGKLEPQLIPALSHFVSDFPPATQAERNAVMGIVSAADHVFVGKLRGRLAFVVEAPDGRIMLYVDADADGQVGVKEAYQLGPGVDELQAGTATVSFPLSGLWSQSYPVKVYLYRRRKQDEPYRVGASPSAYVLGHVDVDGKSLLVEYLFDLKENRVPLDRGCQAMDVNGDGKIDQNPLAREWVYPENEVVVFHVGERYLRTKAVDLVKGEVVLESCPVSAYHTIELTEGSQLPDISFEEFSGKRRTLSEFRGKYVLLDFWATWCGPCVKDLPHLSEVYERFRNKGFEIIGMNGDEEEAKARRMIEQKGLAWKHATYSSIREVVQRSFRIQTWPTYVLLDRDGQIVSSRQEDLRGAALDRTLERLLP